MPGRADGGAGRARGRAPGLLQEAGGAGARLQQVPRQDGQEHPDAAQGAEAKVSAARLARGGGWLSHRFLIVAFLVFFLAH
jgi:hypothetical protein